MFIIEDSTTTLCDVEVSVNLVEQGRISLLSDSFKNMLTIVLQAGFEFFLNCVYTFN